MEKKPLTMVAKDARDAANKLNEYVENGGFKFDFGIIDEYVITVSKNSDGSKKEEKEKRYRFTGFVDTYMGDELEPLNQVREEIKALKGEREEMNRTLKVMNKSPFAPISILLMCVALITLTFGILTLAGILPLPPEQIAIAIILVVVGSLALGGSITLTVLRARKKKALLARKDEILQSEQNLKNREADLDRRTPQWYKDALWRAEGNTIRNATQCHTLK